MSIIKRTLKSCIAFLVILVVSVSFLVSCGTKLERLFEIETLAYSYEKLSEGLLRIDYVNITVSYDENGRKEECVVYKTLNEEESERVLQGMNGIEFKVPFGTSYPEVTGDALVFCYPEYKLYISPGDIEKRFEEGYTNESGEKLRYNVRTNKDFEKLMDSIKDR